MKKPLATILVIAMMLSISACGAQKGPKGTYQLYYDDTLMGTIEFSKEKVTMTIGLPGVYETVSEGTFVYENGEINCSFEDGGSDVYTYDADTDTLSYHDIFYGRK